MPNSKSYHPPAPAPRKPARRPFGAPYGSSSSYQPAPYGSSSSYQPATDACPTPFVPAADVYSPPPADPTPRFEGDGLGSFDGSGASGDY